MTRPSHSGRPDSAVVDPWLWHAIRGVAGRGLVDELELLRAEVGTIIDPDTLIETPAPPALIWSGPGNIQPMVGLNERRVIIGAETRTTNRYVASIEWDAAEILVDDIVRVAASADPRMHGREVVVRDVLGDTFQSRRVVICEDDASLPTPEVS